MANVEKITIALTAEQAAFVRSMVATGRFASTSEAIRDAVRQWQDRRDLAGFTVGELQALVDEGLASGPSQHATFDDLKAHARSRLSGSPQT